MRNAMWVGGGITGMGEIPMLGVKEKGIAKVIRDIFRNGEQGFFYDPSDLKTQYQDAAGTTEVNATGQPLGLVLDKSKPITAISILDSAFLLADGWTKNNPEISVSNVDGSLRVSKGAINPQSIYRTFSCESGKLYRLTVKYKNHTGNNVRFFVRNASGVGIPPTLNQYVQTFTTTEGEGSSFFISTSNTHSVVIDSQNASESSVDVESIVITKVSDSINHAYQTTSAARPVLQQTPILGSELVVNGDFSNGVSGWTANGATLNNISGELEIVSAAGAPSARQVLNTQVGKTYEVSFNFRRGTTPNNNLFRVGTTAGGVNVLSISALTVSGKYTARFIATTTTSHLSFGYGEIAAGQTSYWDNISVKEILGYRTDQNHIEYDGVDDKLLTNLPAPLVNATVLRSIPNVGTQVKYNQTLPMLYEDSTSHAGLIAIDRALTRSEQLRLMTELDKKAGATSFDTTTFKMFDPTQQGFYYDPNDLSTMFQNANGTVPVTAVGQPVGLIKDKSGRGNHASQPVSASRPVLTNRVNLFNDSELFSAWIRNDGVALATPNPKYPNAIKLAYGSDLAIVHRSGVSTVGTYTLTGLFKNVVGNVYGRVANNNTPAMVKVGTTPDGLDIYQTTLTIASILNSAVTGVLVNTPGSSVEIYGLDVRPTQQGSALPPYQKVVGSTQFDSVGFANYLLFDGVDDFLQTNNIDFTPTDKISLFAGVQKLSDSVAALVEFSTNSFAITQTFGLISNQTSVSKNYLFRSSGSILCEAFTLNNSFPSPISNVLTATSSISGDSLKLKVDGRLERENTQDQGTGNYGNHPLYIGRRGGVILPFNGHIYGLIGIGKLTTDTETTVIEKEIAKRVGVDLNV